jgi:sorbitol/mannitol transport system permease protein
MFGENAPQPDLMTSNPLLGIGIVLVWQWTPFMMLIMLAGLQSRPMDVYEAALVDGAGPWQTFRFITLPHLRRYIELAALLGTIYIVQNFDMVFTMTSGGLGTATLPYVIYQEFFVAQDYGVASAVGVIVVIASLITRDLRPAHRIDPAQGGELMSTPDLTVDNHPAPGVTPTPTEPGGPGSAEPPRRKANAPRRPGQGRAGKILLGLLAWFVGLLFVSPLLWMLLTSLHAETDASTNPPSYFAPLTLESFVNFFGGGNGANPWPFLINSAVAAIVSTLIVLVLSTMAAYSLAIRRIERWSDVLFFLLSTKMLPMVAGLLPVYLVAKSFGILDTWLLLIIIYSAMNMPIAVWMMRSFLAEVPVEVLEAAELDGARLPRVFLQILLPLTAPGLAATALICFIFSWNELLFATVLTSTAASTAPVFLTSFVTSQGLFLSQVCAASLIISVPVLVAGIAAQDKLVQGLSMGAVK